MGNMSLSYLWKGYPWNENYINRLQQEKYEIGGEGFYMKSEVKDLFGYENEVAVVTGAASGMGKETAQLLVELGAEVYGLDINEVKVSGVKYVHVDLVKKDSIEAALRQLPPKVDKIFPVAGITPVYRGRTVDIVDVVMINFVGHRHLIENLLPRMPDGRGAIAIVASMGGAGWMMILQDILAFLSISEWDSARAWLEAHKEDPKIIGGPTEAQRPYMFSKECLVMYAKMRSWQLAQRGIRINTVSPGITDTPFAEETPPELGKKIISPIGRWAKAVEQAWALIFLNSKLASYISGTDLLVDFGFMGGVYTGQVEFPKEIG